jgi:hypothetical protein
VKPVNPYSIHLCYGGPEGSGNAEGVAWSGNSGSHHVTFTDGTGSVDFSSASGSGTSTVWHVRGGNNDNATITWIDNGASHSTRWGDAPPC